MNQLEAIEKLDAYRVVEHKTIEEMQQYRHFPEFQQRQFSDFCCPCTTKAESCRSSGLYV